MAPDEVKKNISVSDENGLSVKNETAAKENYMIQYFVGNNVSLKKGTDYSIKITMKGSTDGHATVGMGTWGCSQTRVDFTDQYATYTLPYTSAYEGEDGLFLCRVVILTARSALNLYKLFIVKRQLLVIL